MKIFQKNKKSEDKSAQQDNGQVCVEDSGNNLYAVGSEQADNGNFQPRQVEDDQDVNQAISESGNKTDGVADSSNVVGSNTKESSSSQSGDNSGGDIKNSVVIKGNNFGWVINIVRNGVSKLWVENKIEESKKKDEVERAALETRISKCLLIKIANNEHEIKKIKEVLNEQIEKQNDFESAITAAVEELSAHWENFYSDIEDQLQKVEDKVEDLDSQVAKANKNIEAYDEKIKALERRQTESMKQFASWKKDLDEVHNKNKELKAEVEWLKLKELLKQLKELFEEGGKEPKRDRRDPYYENDCCPRCGSYHSFDIYNEGKTEKDSYYICAVCGRRDDARDNTTIIKDDKRINPELHVLGASELDNPMNDHNLTSLKRVLVRDNIQKIGTSQSGSAINKYYGNLEIFSLSNPNKKGEPYYTLGKGLFDFSNNSEWIKLKLYGMKYVEKIEDGCFIGIQGDEERQNFWDENGFKIERKEKYFAN